MAILLHEEYECLRQKINTLNATQRQNGRDMKEALSQSSETWHDNAPRDALMESAKVTAQSLENLVKTMRSAVIATLEVDEFRVWLWTSFALEDWKWETTVYQMTGTQNFLDIENGLPVDSPLGKIIFGKEFYDDVEFNGANFTIIPI